MQRDTSSVLSDVSAFVAVGVSEREEPVKPRCFIKLKGSTPTQPVSD